MVQSHIKSLLYAYDCVIIPEFGGLITHYAPAKIHPVKHTFTPPSKRIAFNEQLKANDGLLISTLAQRQQWEMPQAQRAVAEFVQELKEQLKTQHRFELQDVGVFRYNAERKVEFESLESLNFLEHSFGLPELVAKPILGKETLVLRGKYQDGPAVATGPKTMGQRFRKLYRVGASLVIGGLAVSAVYLLSIQNEVALSSLNPFALISTTQSTTPSGPQTAETDSFEQAQLTEQYKATMPAETSIEEELAAEDSVLASFAKNGSKTANLEVQETASIPVTPEASTAANPTITTSPALAETKEAVAAKPVATPAVAEGTTIKRKTGRFYIIMGVFSLDGYAERNLKRLTKKGFNAKVVAPAYDTKRERVSVADFATEAEAYAALPGLRAKISKELWVFNY